jgi:hypothetical protein
MAADVVAERMPISPATLATRARALRRDVPTIDISILRVRMEQHDTHKARTEPTRDGAPVVRSYNARQSATTIVI